MPERSPSDPPPFTPTPAPLPDVPRIEQVADARYWSQRYRDGDTPWDMQGETPVFRAMRMAGALPVGPRRESGEPTRTWVPGCGSGYDAVALAAAGYHVVGVDFAPEALARVRELAAAQGVAERVETVEADVFALPESFREAFDLAIEYTCYCAIHPSRRRDYARVVADSLRPGGHVVALLYPTDGRPGGPPFAVRPRDTQQEFADVGLELVYSETPQTSHPKRLGNERLMVFRKQ